jgi:signal transduction histidine kinase
LRGHWAGSAHLDDLIHDLLAYSRLSREEIRPGPVSIEGIVSGVLRQLEPDLGESLSRVAVERPMPVLCGHGAVLIQVLGNSLQMRSSSWRRVLSHGSS